MVLQTLGALLAMGGQWTMVGITIRNVHKGQMALAVYAWLLSLLCLVLVQVIV